VTRHDRGFRTAGRHFSAGLRRMSQSVRSCTL
jgi:hypothetical protein